MEAEPQVKRILITGGAGFVGSSLALRLRESNPDGEVICLDNLHRHGSELNRQRIVKAGVTYVKGDVRDRQAFEMAPCDLIIDAAAEPSVLAGHGGDAGYVVDTNLGGTLNVLEAARKWGSRLVFLSTSRVYPIEKLRSINLEETPSRFEISAVQRLAGITRAGVSEEFPLDGSRTLYGATKYASEVMVAEYAAQFGIRAIINRCGVLAGPWQMGRVDQGVVALWVAAHLYGRPLVYIGYGGRQVRDVLHVEDLADLVLKQLASDKGWSGDVFNVGGSRAISFSLRELTEMARKSTGKAVDVGADDRVRAGDVPLYVTDSWNVRRAFNWQPNRSIEEIVGDTADWIRENEEMLRPFLGG